MKGLFELGTLREGLRALCIIPTKVRVRLRLICLCTRHVVQVRQNLIFPRIPDEKAPSLV